MISYHLTLAHNENDMKIIEESSDDDDEQEEQEQEEEEEEDDSSTFSIFSVEVPGDFPLTVPDSNSKSNSKKRPRSKITKYIRINPLATVISEVDIERYNNTETSIIDQVDKKLSSFYIIHSGYGNEQFESTNRVKIVINSKNEDEINELFNEDPDCSVEEVVLLAKKLAEKVVEHLKQFPEIPNVISEVNDSSTSQSNSFSTNFNEFLVSLQISQLSKKNEKKNTPLIMKILGQILYSFCDAGLITIYEKSENDEENNESNN